MIWSHPWIGLHCADGSLLSFISEVCQAWLQPLIYRFYLPLFIIWSWLSRQEEEQSLDPDSPRCTESRFQTRSQLPRNSQASHQPLNIRKYCEGIFFNPCLEVDPALCVQTKPENSYINTEISDVYTLGNKLLIWQWSHIFSGLLREFWVLSKRCTRIL